MADLSLPELKDIAERAEMILTLEASYLPEYLNNSRTGFRADERRGPDETNVTTTSFCVFDAIESPALRRALAEKCGVPDDDSFLVRITRGLVKARWSSEGLPEFNIYTTPIVLTALLRLQSIFEPGSKLREAILEAGGKEKLVRALKSVSRNVSSHRAAAFDPYEPSGYLSFWSWEAMRLGAKSPFVDNSLRELCNRAARKLGDWAESEVYRQIALSAARDSSSFDATQLAYALAIQVGNRSTGRKLPVDKLTAQAIDTVFGAQLEDGLWPKSHPIFHFRKRGTVYSFSLEVVHVLLSLQEQLEAGAFDGQLARLAACLRWAEQNKKEEKPPGWGSDHQPFPGGPQAWSTATVFMAVRRIASLVDARKNDLVLSHFRATRYTTPDASALGRNEFYDSEVTLSGTAKPCSLRGLILKHFIDCRPGNAAIEDRKYLGIFFGPPGTAKTKLARAISKALGWPFVYLQTSDFAAKGRDRVCAEARDIFGLLGELRHVVVLIDEVEEFVRNRGAEDDAGTRMTTTAMLSLLQELRSKEQVILIVTTNHMRDLDPAVIRPGGRFDVVLLVGPPSVTEKKRMFGDALAKTISDQDVRTSAQTVLDSLADSDQSVPFFTFPDWLALVNKACKEVLSRRTLTKDWVTQELRKARQGMTISGEVQNEYKDSMSLSRVY